MTPTTATRAERLYSLDAARAIAALAVVFQHWEHFFTLAPFAAQISDAPLFSLFQPLYEKGGRAVTFFFCLSGFIFYWLYAGRIRERAVSSATFAALRLSRLYPLHLLTLLICLALQWPLIEMLGAPFIYAEHDLKHFVLNLLLVQYWGFEDGFSFNGPSWSISVELLLYIAFFFACRFVRPSIWQCLALAVVGVLLARFSILAGAAAPFFLGGAAFYVYGALAPRWTPLRNLILVVSVIALWVLLPLALQPGVLSVPFGDKSLGRIVESASAALAARQYELILFPLTVLTCALSEAAWSRVPWRWLHDLGNMSFGIYLLHFPLQLVLVLIALTFAFPADFFRQPSTLVLFFLALIALAALSYRLFEKPTMLALRRMWKPSRATPKAPTVEPAKPSAPAKAVEAEDDHFPEAYVTDVHHIKDANFKIFSTAGGDPAINGLYTYLARYNDDERGWTQVYMLGDFNSWEVAEESATRVVLKISRSWVEQESGDIKTADEKLIVDLPATGETPVMVTPAT